MEVGFSLALASQFFEFSWLPMTNESTVISMFPLTSVILEIPCLHLYFAKCFKLPFKSNTDDTENINSGLLHFDLFSLKAVLAGGMRCALQEG